MTTVRISDAKLKQTLRNGARRVSYVDPKTMLSKEVVIPANAVVSIVKNGPYHSLDVKDWWAKLHSLE